MKDISADDLKNNMPLVTRKNYQRKVAIGDIELSKEKITIMAGPCTVESKAQIMDIAKNVKELGAGVLRAGVFKPLTFPYGDPLARPDDGKNELWDPKKILSRKEQDKAAEIRLGYLKEAGAKYNLPVISEILCADSLEMMIEYVDMFQIGYRHMFNMDLMEALSGTDKPIMIKRHYGESLRSLLGVAEHFEARGKHNFVFCERGIAVPHTHNPNSRAVIDIQAIAVLNEYAPSVLIFADPSHSTFRRRYVPAIAKAAIAAGADGILIEVHFDPDRAWVDPLNAINYGEFDKLMKEIRGIARVLGK